MKIKLFDELNIYRKKVFDGYKDYYEDNHDYPDAAYKKIDRFMKQKGILSSVPYTCYNQNFVDCDKGILILNCIFGDKNEISNISKTLDNVNIKKVYIIDNSTALMRIIHYFAEKGWNIKPEIIKIPVVSHGGDKSKQERKALRLTKNDKKSG